MADRVQSRDPLVVDIENMERLWNDAILRRDVDSAASMLAPEFRLVIGVEGQSLQVVPRELWLAVLPRYVIHGHEITDMHAGYSERSCRRDTRHHLQPREPLNDRDISGTCITDIWVLRNEKWLSRTPFVASGRRLGYKVGISGNR